MNTVVVEVEGVLNRRPLTYSSDEQYCSSLTPNHLMYGRSLFNSSKGVSSEISASIDCQKIVQHHIVVTKHFKQRFINEYLTALQERHYYYQNKRKSIKNNVKIREVVLIKEKISYLKWQNRKITSLIKSKDGLVCSVELAIYQKQQNKVNNIKRPVQLIVPMEIMNTDDDITNNKDVNEPTKDEKRRSQREAARNANMLSKLNEY